MTTPYEVVRSSFVLPHPADKFHEKQIALVNDLAPIARAGYYAKVGTGKTSMSAVSALYQQLMNMADVHLVIVPPILITQWVKWLSLIPGVKAVAYKGTPKKRKAISFAGARFVVMSLEIFKNDFEYLTKAFSGLRVGGILDEATSIKNIESQNYRRIREFFNELPLMLLTGTPCATPLDSYAYIKLIAPACYRNQKVFDSLHIGERDFFGRIVEWNNLDLLKRNMEINTRRLDKRDIFDLPLPVYTPVEYELAEEHYALYKLLCEQQVLELEDGGKIDASTVAKLWTCCQQIVLNWEHFSGRAENRSAGLDLLDEVLDELEPEGKKLIVVANYRMTMARVMRHLQERGKEARLINSTVSKSQQERNANEFRENDKISVLLLHPQSGGKGLDGLQLVCSDMLFLEEPLSPIDFEQPVGRIDRPGQTEAPNVRLAVAQHTIQVRLHNLLLRKDELASRVTGWSSIREALYGG